MTEDLRLRERIHRLVDPLPPANPSIEAVRGRARTLRLRRSAVATFVSILVAAAIAVPLSRLGALGERGRPAGSDGPSPSVTPSPEPKPVPDEGPVLEVPPGWFLDDDPLPALVRPRIVAAAGSWRFPRHPLIACGPQPALEAMPPDAAFVWIYRYDIPEGEPLGSFRDAAPWPASFELDLPSSPADVECAAGSDGPVRNYLFTGPDHRYYDVLVAFGVDADDATRRQVERVLSSFSP